MAAGAAGVRVSQPQLPFPVPKLALGTPAALPAPRGGGRRVSQRGPARLTAMKSSFRNPPHPLPGPSTTAEASRTAQPARRPPPWAPRFPSQPGRFGLCELPNTSLVSRRARAPRGGASPSPLPARRCSAQINADEALAAGAAGSPACAWGPPQPVPGHLGPAQGARCGRDLPPPAAGCTAAPAHFAAVAWVCGGLATCSRWLLSCQAAGLTSSGGRAACRAIELSLGLPQAPSPARGRRDGGPDPHAARCGTAFPLFCLQLAAEVASRRWTMVL